MLIKAAIDDYKKKQKMITVTSNAVNHIKKLISSRESKPSGIKIGIETKGCSGLSYSMEFVDEPNKDDEVINVDDIKIYVDPKATLFFRDNNGL